MRRGEGGEGGGVWMGEVEVWVQRVGGDSDSFGGFLKKKKKRRGILIKSRYKVYHEWHDTISTKT